MLFYFGDGCQKLRRRVEIELSSVVRLTPVVGAPVDLRVVRAYKHVGSRMVGGATVLSEIRCRFAFMHEAARPLGSPHLP